MDTIDTKKLQTLLAEKKWDEAKTLLTGFFHSGLTPQEKGALYVQIASIYLDIKNKMDKEYSQGLGDIIDIMEQVTKVEKGVIDKAELNKVRKEIEES